jgi:hypothetical protein
MLAIGVATTGAAVSRSDKSAIKTKRSLRDSCRCGQAGRLYIIPARALVILRLLLLS